MSLSQGLVSLVGSILLRLRNGVCSGGGQVLLGLYSVAVGTVAVFKEGDYYLYVGG